MTMRPLLIAATVAALSFVGSSARAAFTYSTSSSIAGVPFGSTSNPTFVDTGTVTVQGSTAIAVIPVDVVGPVTSNYSFTLNTTYRINGVNAATLSTKYNVFTDGRFFVDSLVLTTLATIPSGFSVSNPVATNGDFPGTMTANTALRITQTGTPAVPEPASFAMVGLGLMGVGMMARRKIKG